MGSVETGLPISRRTTCCVGSHVFVTANSDAGSALRDWADYCDCGLMVWEPGTPEPVSAALGTGVSGATPREEGTDDA